MAREPSFEDLIARLRQGDADAAEEVFRRFAGRLIALARQRLEERIRQKVDPEDVMQSSASLRASTTWTAAAACGRCWRLQRLRDPEA